MEKAAAVWLKLGNNKIQAYQITQDNQRRIVFTHRLMAEPIGKTKSTAQRFCKTHELELPPTITAIVPDKPRPVALSSWEAALAYWQSQAKKGNTAAKTLAEAASATSESALEIEAASDTTTIEPSYPKDIEAVLAALPSGEDFPNAASAQAMEEGLRLIARWLEEAGLNHIAIAQWKLGVLASRFPALAGAAEDAKKLLAQQDPAPSGMIASQVAQKVSEALDRKVSAAEVNTALHDLNFQTWAKSGSRERQLTDRGMAHGRAVLTTSKTNAWSGAQLRWFDSIVPVLCEYFQTQRSNGKNRIT